MNYSEEKIKEILRLSGWMSEEDKKNKYHKFWSNQPVIQHSKILKN